MTNEEMMKLESLITDVSNTSHRCGAHNIDADEDGYDSLLDKAYAAEAALKKFVLKMVRASASGEKK